MRKDPPETALPNGRIKAAPADFVVDEIPAYLPSGAGEHVYVRFTKTDLTTPDAMRLVARALGCDPRESGCAGMKDKRAVTTQTVSLHAPRGIQVHDLVARARALELAGIVVHDAVAHGNKLKPGHLEGNRFVVAVRDVPCDRLGDVGKALEKITREGVPNAFGAQRFGVAGDNAARALGWLRGEERGPRDPKMRRFLWSSLQSAIFNAVLAERIADGTWATALEGDLLKLRASGGLFVCADVQTDRERAFTGEVSPTGPLVGVSMRAPDGPVGALERRIADAWLGNGVDLGRTRALGEGSRRALRVWVQDLQWRWSEDTDVLNSRGQGGSGGKGTACVWVDFMLPKGAYATTVLARVFAINETRDDLGHAATDATQIQEEEHPRDME